MEHQFNFEVPLELQFSVRKAALAAKELTWEQLYAALMNLYQQRLMEWYAVKSLLEDEDIEINFDVPTDLEMMKLASAFNGNTGCYDDDDEDDMRAMKAPF